PTTPELGDRRPRRGLLLGERTGASDTATTPAHAARRATGTSGAATTPAPAARRPDRRLRLALAGTPGEGPTRRHEARSAPPPAHAQTAESEYQGAAALGLALRRLGNTARVLVIAAHPDDENTPLLSALALGSGADVAYLSLTRGEGGQNAIGPELQEALGLL